MIDRDGIERPDDFSAHEFDMPHKKKGMKITEKTYYHKNPFYRFYCKIIRGVVVVILYPFHKLKYGLKVYGKENLKKVKGKAAISISNHALLMDFPIIAINVMPYRMNRIVAMEDNFNIPIAGKIIKWVGGIPLPNDIGHMRFFLKGVEDTLKRGEMLHMMPEGSMWRYYRDVRPFQIGTFKMAVKGKVPILPIALTFKVMKKKNGKLKYRVRIFVLEPIYPDANILSKKLRAEKLRDEAYLAIKQCVDRENHLNDNQTL